MLCKVDTQFGVLLYSVLILLDERCTSYKCKMWCKSVSNLVKSLRGMRMELQVRA